MKVVILAGGLGTRLSEETVIKPKPMVEIGGRPILWHIMKIYSTFGLNDFIICLGYRGYLIKEYFSNYFLHNANVTIDLKNNQTKIHSQEAEPWVVTLVDTGVQSMTGGRVKRIEPFLDQDDDFCLTYGDGLADINIKRLLSFHHEHGKLATVTAAQAPGRFGALQISEQRVTGFQEKPHGDGGWINGGFFVLNRKVISLIKDDLTVWEKDPLEHLATRGELMTYKHGGFWQPMDTLREKHHLEELWSSGKCPWKVWK
ncbi:MAG: glucose-1-phosphate cytidylyltransferase [Bdellovibrio sp.]|nr:MAG: glucose-1-phosphate cytidylyltransferase [Bdellovibrio sp.]